MFEKEAEEYADVPFSPKTDSELMALCFKDGAEFGYNKAKEELEKDNNRLFLEGAKRVEELEAQIEKMKSELHHRLVSPSHSDSDCLDKIIGLDRLWQFGQEF